MINKKISIIVAAYNVEAYIERAMESILSQTYQNLQVIVVDDGSEDATGAIADRYAANDERVTVIHKENGGLSDARNAAIPRITGDYVGFVDADDWIEPDMYYSLLTACETYGAQIGICRYHEYQDEHRVDGNMSTPSHKTVPMSREEVLQIYLAGHPQYVIYNSVWSKLFSAEIVKKHYFQTGRKSEDIMYTTWAFCDARQIVYLDTPYYNYVLNRTGSIMNSGLFQRRKEHELPNWREQIAYLKSCDMPEMADLAAYHFYRRLLFYYLDGYDKTGKDPSDRKSGKAFSKWLIKQMRAEKTDIIRLLKKPYATTGDRLRMKCFLTCPHFYVWINRLYLALRT